MKTMACGFAVSLMLGLGLTGCASNPNAAPTRNASQSTEKGGTYLTGSYLRQNAERKGRITSGSQNVQVYDQQDIQRSGADSVSDFLRRQGATTP